MGEQGETAAASLDKALFAPLATVLKGIAAVDLAPAGRLGLIPYDVLGPEWDRLSSRFALRLIPSGRVLGRKFEANAAAELVAFADIDYDAPPATDRTAHARRWLTLCFLQA